MTMTKQEAIDELLRFILFSQMHKSKDSKAGQRLVQALEIAVIVLEESKEKDNAKIST